MLPRCYLSKALVFCVRLATSVSRPGRRAAAWAEFMVATQSRFGPLQLLDADWRRKTWKHWLRSRLADGDAPRAPAAEVRATTITPPPPERNTLPPRDTEARRSDVRARFDALFDRLLALEDTLDAFGKRFALKAVHERRHEQRLLERVENTADVLERQALSLETLATTMQRMEQRIERIERSLRSGGTTLTNELTESRRVPARDNFDDLSDFEEAFSAYPAAETRSSPPEGQDDWDNGAHVGSSIRGNLSEMSLATVLAMLELERRTGILTVCAENGSVVTATLRGGTIVGARNQDVAVDPVEAVRDALRITTGRFSFRQVNVEVVSGPPRSIGSVLLEASSRNDEAARAG